MTSEEATSNMHGITVHEPFRAGKMIVFPVGIYCSPEKTHVFGFIEYKKILPLHLVSQINFRTIKPSDILSPAGQYVISLLETRGFCAYIKRRAQDFGAGKTIFSAMF